MDLRNELYEPIRYLAHQLRDFTEEWKATRPDFEEVAATLKFNGSPQKTIDDKNSVYHFISYPHEQPSLPIEIHMKVIQCRTYFSPKFDGYDIYLGVSLKGEDKCCGSTMVRSEPYDAAIEKMLDAQETHDYTYWVQKWWERLLDD